MVKITSAAWGTYRGFHLELFELEPRENGYRNNRKLEYPILECNYFEDNSELCNTETQFLFGENRKSSSFPQCRNDMQ